jgi:alkylhydroperoxidase/carboxymuconolactone decarboxylase family protein YurZ
MAVTDILTAADLLNLRNAYNANLAEMTAILSAVGLDYPPVQDWLTSVGNTMFRELSPTPAPNLPVLPIDRERCLIALIAERRETLNLAVHIYMGLMNGLSPAEVANVLALTGIYGGISAYIRGIRVAEQTFKVLEVLAPLPIRGPKAAVTALSVTFGSWNG